MNKQEIKVEELKCMGWTEEKTVTVRMQLSGGMREHKVVVMLKGSERKYINKSGGEGGYASTLAKRK